MFDLCGLKVDTAVPELGTTAGDALLAPHRSYLNAMRPLVAAGLVKGMAHITGGGITENLPRTLPAGCAADVDRRSWSVPPIFAFLRIRGDIAEDEMLRAFNMGVGLIAVVEASSSDRALDLLRRGGEQPIALGRVVPGDRGVRYVS